MKILVTGGTGHLGRELVRLAGEKEHEIRLLSRSPAPQEENHWFQGDLVSGDGITEAVTGIDAVVHLASDPKRAPEVDVTGTRYLVRAANRARVKHFVYISIVGIDDIPLGYYQHKREAEKIISFGGVPYSILRATQFHSFLDELLTKAAHFPLAMPLPAGFRFQCVDTVEVAQQLMVCLENGPQGHLPDFGGPEVQSLSEMAKVWMDIKGVRKRVLPLPIPGGVAAGFRAGKNTAPQGVRGNVSWCEWLRGC